ncbi:unnamed protein product [Chironomus riparius]|uniref:Protein lin-37 homolog n=1 Tax=Chironomus riparius TaxID=315576 RepID=A0A9N9WP69_9DIPT|nr:unnamed protein product [Chironomus riparius]
MATKVKQESDSKSEARSKLNEALALAETEVHNMLGSEEEEEVEDEEMLEQEDEELVDTKTIIKSEHVEGQNEDLLGQDEEILDEEDEEYAPIKKEPKSSVKLPKPVQLPSYIMKLFDRSVNLAKFDEDTPLYPLCRAWMKNQPRAPAVKSEKTTDPIIQTVEDGDVVEMPKIRIRKPKHAASKPENKLNKKDFDKLIDSEVWTKEKLLEYHRTQWLDEKARQIETSRIFEEKHFTANLQLLDSLRKDAEE